MTQMKFWSTDEFMRVSNSSVAMTGEIRMSSLDKSKVAETKHKMKVVLFNVTIVEFVKIKLNLSK